MANKSGSPQSSGGFSLGEILRSLSPGANIIGNLTDRVGSDYDDYYGTKRLLTRAGGRALNQERDLILTSFGFNSTSAEGVARGMESNKIRLVTEPGARKRDNKNKDTLL